MGSKINPRGSGTGQRPAPQIHPSMSPAQRAGINAGGRGTPTNSGGTPQGAPIPHAYNGVTPTSKHSPVPIKMGHRHRGLDHDHAAPGRNMALAEKEKYGRHADMHALGRHIMDQATQHDDLTRINRAASGLTLAQTSAKGATTFTASGGGK
jgi:hypothetical protein